MKQLVLPKKIKVGGISYSIVFPYKFSETTKYLGVHKGSEATILVGNQNSGVKLKNEVVMDTFIHEILHAVDYVYLNWSLKEETIAVLAKVLISFFKENDFNLNNKVFPDQIKIFTSVFDVVSDYQFNEIKNVCATLDPQKCIILSDVTKNNASVVKSSIFECCLSCMFDAYKINDIELLDNELFIGAFAAGIYQVFLDNKLEKLIKNWA